MAAFRDRGFVGEESLTLVSSAEEIRMVGEIACLGDIAISVDKVLAILGGEGESALVHTVEYAYNACVRGHGNLLRHDNAEHYANPDWHHRHEFNWRTGEQTALVWVGEEGWPTLGDFIDEIEDWYRTHAAELPNPDAFPQLGLR